MLCHGSPDVLSDVLDGGTLPWYQLDELCEHWTVKDGQIEAVPYGEMGKHLVVTDSEGPEDVVGPLTRKGCTFIIMVQIEKSYGGLGFKVVNSHLGCDECLVQATMTT